MSAWTDGGFPFGFRFKNPRDVLHTVCCAMTERSVNQDQADTTDYSVRARYRPEADIVQTPPVPFYTKTAVSADFTYDYGKMFKFMGSRIMYIASCYCDPDKAYDFDNYPDLQNWTPESLEDKLKEHYVKFSPFCDKEKYLMFIYRVLNLCTVRRVPVCSEYGTSRSREAYGGWRYSELDKAKERLLSEKFSIGGGPSHKFTVWTDSIRDYEMRQSGIRFLTWIDEARPCDTVFYGFAEDTCNEFSAPPALNVKKNSWFCAGSPNLVENYGGVMRLALELDVADVDVKDIPELPMDYTWTSGFSLKYFKNNNLNSCFGYAVRDQRKYLKYFER